jgi:hypothetical protein
MAMHTETNIYKAAMKLTVYSSRLVSDMPRNFRSVDGALLVGHSRALLKHIRYANQAFEEKKVPHLDMILDVIVDVNVELQVCVDLRLISKPNHASAMLLSESVHKQANGLRRKYASQPDSQPPR